MAVAMVESGLGVAVLPGLDLADLAAGRKVKAIPLAGGMSRKVCMLCPKEAERSPMIEDFLELVRETVEAWKNRHTEK
jgi:DNA-binding transcriptional LysR family regulator